MVGVGRVPRVLVGKSSGIVGREVGIIWLGASQRSTEWLAAIAAAVGIPHHGGKVRIIGIHGRKDHLLAEQGAGRLAAGSSEPCLEIVTSGCRRTRPTRPIGRCSEPVRANGWLGTFRPSARGVHASLSRRGALLLLLLNITQLLLASIACCPLLEKDLIGGRRSLPCPIGFRDAFLFVISDVVKRLLCQ